MNFYQEFVLHLIPFFLEWIETMIEENPEIYFFNQWNMYILFSIGSLSASCLFCSYAFLV